MQLVRAAAAALVLAALAGSAQAGGVLRVNGVEVSAGDLAIARYKAISDRPVLSGDEPALTRAAVDLLVGDILLADAARAAGVTITEKEARKGIATLEAQLGGKAKVKALLAEVGATQAELEALAARRMLGKRFVDTGIAPAVAVSDEEARAYYETPEHQIYHGEQIKLRMIFVNAAPGIGAKEEAKARERIEEAERRVVAGEPFGTVAREVSDDMSKANGGEFGWMGSEAIPPAFLGKVWAIAPGELSGVLRGQFGFAVIEVLDKRSRGAFPFEEMRDQIVGQLRKSRLDEAVAKVVGERRAAAAITALVPDLEAALR